MADRSKAAGIVAILAASVMWAVEPICAKLAYEQSDFLTTSAVRAVIVLLIALAYALITGRRERRRERRPVTRAQLGVLVYIGLAGTVFADLIYFYALTRVPVANAVLIGHMQPIFVVLIGFFILREDKLTRRDYLGIGIMIAAGLLATTKTPENLRRFRLGSTGDLYVLAATVAWATTGIAMRKYLRQLNAGVITFCRYLVASAVLVTWSLCRSGFVMPNVYQILVGVVVGIGTLLYYESLKRLKAAQVSALELSTPFFAAVLGFLWLRETVTGMQAAGIALLFAGVYFLSRKEEAYF